MQQPPHPQLAPWLAANPYQQAAVGAPVHYRSEHAHQHGFGDPHGVGAASVQSPVMRQHFLPAAQQQSVIYMYGGRPSGSGVAGFAQPPWWWQQQQQQQQLLQRMPPQHAVPPPWLAAGGQSPGMTAGAAGLGHGPILSPPSAVPTRPQCQAYWQRPVSNQFQLPGSSFSPAQPAVGVPRPVPAQQHPLMPTGQYLPHGLPAHGASSLQVARQINSDHTAQWSGGLACGTPSGQLPLAATPNTMPRVSPMPQRPDFAARILLPSAAVSARAQPAPSHVQRSRQPSPPPAAPAPAAPPAIGQPDQSVERAVDAVAPVVHAAEARAAGEAMCAGLRKYGNPDAARQRRPPDAETGETCQQREVDISLHMVDM